jgi:hypothetical protein
MKIRLADHLMKKLSQLGTAIDIDRQFQVFEGGVVGIINAEPEKDKESEQEGTRGSATGSWQGPSGPRGTPGEAATRLGLQEQQQQVVQLAGLAELVEAYPSTKIIEVEGGLWIIAKSSPLGSDGPQATIVLAYPRSGAIEPRAWAFWKISDVTTAIGPRHTNFPDGSICAFGAGDWDRAEGVTALVDFYSTWLVRQLYLEHFGVWPGRQHGHSALYRRTEFKGGEWCGCNSGKRYKDCHFDPDHALSDENARAEHREKFGSDYGDRKPPRSLLRFVRSRFSKVPGLPQVYANT